MNWKRHSKIFVISSSLTRKTWATRQKYDQQCYFRIALRSGVRLISDVQGRDEFQNKRLSFLRLQIGLAPLNDWKCELCQSIVKFHSYLFLFCQQTRLDFIIFCRALWNYPFMQHSSHHSWLFSSISLLSAPDSKRIFSLKIELCTNFLYLWGLSVVVCLHRKTSQWLILWKLNTTRSQFNLWSWWIRVAGGEREN